MIDLDRVSEIVCSLSSLEAEELLPFAVLIQNSASAVESALLEPRFADDDRIVMLAAARAYYYIALSGSPAGGVSNFAAGDVKVSYKMQPSDRALALYRTAAEDAAGMVRDNGFVFRDV